MVSSRSVRFGVVLALGALSLLAGVRAQEGGSGATEPVGAARLRLEAEAVGEQFQSELVTDFLMGAATVQDIEPRKVFLDRTTRTWYTPEQAAALPQETREGLREIDADTTFYLGAMYGTPLAYARVLDLAGTCGAQPPMTQLKGLRILDIGYGNIGHLRMMASRGAQAVGVDVDTLQPALYREPGDQGPVNGLDGRPAGTVTLIKGNWPSEEAARGAVGGEYDIITSKNTLKRGYVHPWVESDPRMLVHLDIDDASYVKAVYDALKPGGLFIIYNLCPGMARPGEAYKPMADGRCPFDERLLRDAGFLVMAFDVKDDAEARKMARAFGWDKQGMDLQNDLFAWVTIAWKAPEGFTVGK